MDSVKSSSLSNPLVQRRNYQEIVALSNLLKTLKGQYLQNERSDQGQENPYNPLPRVFEEDHQAVFVLIVLERIDDTSVVRSTLVPELAFDPTDPVVNQPLELDVENTIEKI